MVDLIFVYLRSPQVCLGFSFIIYIICEFPLVSRHVCSHLHGCSPYVIENNVNVQCFSLREKKADCLHLTGISRNNFRRDGSVCKKAYSASRGPTFSSTCPPGEAGSSLQPQFLGTQHPLLVSVGVALIHTWKHIIENTSIFKIKEYLRVTLWVTQLGVESQGYYRLCACSSPGPGFSHQHFQKPNCHRFVKTEILLSNMGCIV